MAKPNNQKNSGNKSSSSKGSSSGKKSGTSSYSSNSVGSGSMGASGSMSSSSMSSGMDSEEGMFGKFKDKLADVNVESLKSSLPSILKWGSIALGAAGVYALYKNREKISQFIEDKDLSLPFLKGEDSSVTASSGTSKKAKSPRLNTVSTNTH